MSDNRFTNPPPVARNVWSGVLFGIGLMALIDEIIFHQLLQWHHFYDKSTPFTGIFTDGLLNAFALFAVVGGLFMFADLHRKHTIHMMRWVASVFTGPVASSYLMASLTIKCCRFIKCDTGSIYYLMTLPGIYLEHFSL